MIVELAAVRLLAPWFGTSHTVWTNVIAVILLALALGYMVGGRLSERYAPEGVLCVGLMLAGAWVTWLPWLVPTLARSLLPEDLALHEAARLLGWGSLAVASIAFLPPAILLGTVCPTVVEGLARARHFSAGRAGGVVLFASTVGSLAGVFGASHALIPGVGIRRTFWLAGGLVFACGVLARAFATSPGMRKDAQSLALFCLAIGGLLPAMPRPRLLEGWHELAQRDSPYQSVRVVEGPSGHGLLRFLQVNEGLDSFQSVWQPEEGVLPDGFYYNDFLLPGAWTEKREPWRVLVLGLGAGSVTRVFSARDWPETCFVGIELDPVVVELGRSFFDLESSPGRIQVLSGLDARVGLRTLEQNFDQVVIDCYANQFEIPAHLCTLEFFGEVESKLEHGGWLTANLGGFGFGDPVVESVSATCATAFDAPVVVVRVPMSRNYMLIARKGLPVPWSNGTLQSPLSSSPLPLASRLLPSFSRLVLPGTSKSVLTDDACPIEQLQKQSLLEASRRQAEAGET